MNYRLTRFVLVLVLLSVVPVTPPVSSNEYHKCTDASGKVFFSNIACPSTSRKTESYKMRETTEREYQDAQRKEDEVKQKEGLRQQAEAQLEKARDKERRLNQCLAEADERYKARWDDTCLFGGGDKGCLLNTDIANGYDRTLRGERQECFLRYR